MLCRYLHSLSHQQWQGLPQWESALPVWQCVMASWYFGKVLTMSFLHTAVMSPTPAGAGSVIWPSYPGGKLTTAGCNSNFILVSLLRCCYDGSAVTHVSNDKQSLKPCSPNFRCECCGPESDLDSPTLWFIITEMRRGLYNVCSTVQCTLPGIECQELPGPGVFYAFLPCNFYTLTLASWMIQFYESKRKMFRL